MPRPLDEPRFNGTRSFMPTFVPQVAVLIPFCLGAIGIFRGR